MKVLISVNIEGISGITTVEKKYHTIKNTAMSTVEKAIGSIKRYNILVHRFRNHKSGFEDAVIGICAGLWNFSLAYS